jgi:Ca-activated chloride channel family protein
MSFGTPLALLALALVPVALAGYVVALRRRRARHAVHFTNLAVLAPVVAARRAWRRWIPAALVLAALALTLAGTARPQMRVSVPRENATVILLVDVSGSMRARDVQPTRLEAAQAAIRRFVDTLPNKLRIALVAFSNEPALVAAPSHDREVLKLAIDQLTFGLGTAIGDGLAAAVEVGRSMLGSERPTEGGASPVSILLLSDGSQTDGALSPFDGARLAKELGIPVYTVALGTPGGVVEIDRSGPYFQTIPVPPDPETLSRVAAITGGSSYEAGTAKRLQNVYREIGSRVGRRREPREVTFAFLGMSAVLLLTGGVLGARWLPRIP